MKSRSSVAALAVDELPAHCTTLEAAKRLGLAVRSVQLMVDRGDLQGWKTAGGHRRISMTSVDAWIRERHLQGRPPQSPVVAVHSQAPASKPRTPRPGPDRPSVLVIEDSIHYQKLLTLLISQRFPEADLHVAGDGVSGLAMCGDIRPEVLIVDILLPGIDGAALISTLRSHDQFLGSQLIVVTSLDEDQREPYAYALDGVPVIHKTRLLADLPATLRRSLDAPRQARE